MKGVQKMFDKINRYITIGIQQEIPLLMQLFIWNLIDKQNGQGQELDYLQVFELRRGKIDDIFFQEIEHSQEVPDYSNILVSMHKKIL